MFKERIGKRWKEEEVNFTFDALICPYYFV
jgi:hypothetical protein